MIMASVKAVIFDIDGTLIDSVDQHAHAWVDAFQEFGHPLEFQQVRSQIGKGGDQLLPMFLSPKELEQEGDALSKRRSQIFHDKYLETIRPFPAVRDLFLKIIDSGQRPAVASSAKGDQLKTFLWIAGVDDLVDVGASSADADRSKPHPDIFHAALEKLGEGVTAADCVVVGDSPYDAEAALKAGITPIGVRCGGFPEADLLAAGCVALYQDPQDLLVHYRDSILVGRTQHARQQSQGGK